MQARLVLQLEIAVTEGTGGFNPLKTGSHIEAFRPGFKPSEASTTVVLANRPNWEGFGFAKKPNRCRVANQYFGSEGSILSAHARMPPVRFDARLKPD